MTSMQVRPTIKTSDTNELTLNAPKPLMISSITGGQRTLSLDSVVNQPC
jgi:hypothetical protein